MQILSAKYIVSSPDVEKCPSPDRPEFAFIGRSNVGKSSLINMLTGQTHLAKTSASPGKTQLINHFLVEAKGQDGKKNISWYLVDLPGYGYAKVAQSKRKTWTKMIAQYIQQRKNLVNLFVLIDVRHKPQALDLAFVDQLGEWKIPFTIVFTKADKTTQREAASSVRNFLDALSERWEQLPPYILTSAVKARGRKELFEQIRSGVNETSALFKKERDR